jgi:pimeloyl-ACP methyl ester carboxylesterase
MIKRLAVAGILLCAAIVLASLVVGWALARPVQERVGSPPEALHAEAVTFPSESGSIVHAWWCPVSDSKAATLLLPGVRANRLSMVDRAIFLRRSGYSVLLIDFQATGETPGHKITFGWRESRDVLAAVTFIRARQPLSQIAIVGSSLGGAAALFATPPLRVQALVLEAVYPTIERATDNRLRNYLGSIGPLGTPLLLSQLSMRLGVSSKQLRPVDHIAAVDCPVLIINGLEDSSNTSEDAMLLYSLARPPKQLWLVPGVGHVDIHRARRADYETRLLSFLSSTLGSPSVIRRSADDARLPRESGFKKRAKLPALKS